MNQAILKISNEKEVFIGKPVMAIKNRKAWCFPDIMVAALRTGITKNDISDAVNGKRKTAGGFRWVYSEIGGKKIDAVIFDDFVNWMDKEGEV